MLDARFAFLRPLTFGPLPAGDALGDFLLFDLEFDLEFDFDLGFDFRLEPPVRDRLVPVCELPIRVTPRVSLRRRREGQQRQLASFSASSFLSVLAAHCQPECWLDQKTSCVQSVA